MEVAIMVLHVLTACAIIGFVLMQHGKGADMGAAFGGGSAGSLFGAAGSANFLSRTTGVLAAVFFITSLGLTWLSSHQNAPSSVMQHAAVPAAPATPATPAKSDAVPTQAPPAGTGSAAPASPAQGAAPTKDAGSKAKDVPN